MHTDPTLRRCTLPSIAPHLRHMLSCAALLRTDAALSNTLCFPNSFSSPDPTVQQSAPATLLHCHILSPVGRSRNSTAALSLL